MPIIRNVTMLFFFFFCFSLKHKLTFGADSLYAYQSLSGAHTIVSPNGNFKLGFFHPGTSVSKNSRYYLGIWYNKLIEGDNEVSVWIANREKPIYDKESAVLKILDKNLVLLNEFQEPIWSTNIEITSSRGSNDLVAVLGDDGNLVLTDVANLDTKSPFWQSFDHPGNTWLPGIKILFNKHVNTSRTLTSWKNDIDPAPGLYAVDLHRNSSQLTLMWNGSQTYFTYNRFLLARVDNYLYNLSYVDNENEIYFTYYPYNPATMSRYVMESNGECKQYVWMDDSKEWRMVFSDPTQLCQVYAYCGAFGICDNTSLSNCGCPDGFNSYTTDGVKVPSGGCLRNKPLQCRNATISNDRFKEISNIFLTEQSPILTVVSIAECESTCLSNCFCTAYAYDNGRCSVWNDELLNMSRIDRGKTIYIRLANSEFSYHDSSKGRIIIGVVLGATAIFLGIFLLILCRRRNKMISKSVQDSVMASPNREARIARKKVSDMLRWGVFGCGYKRKLVPLKEELLDIPIFTFEMIQVATDDFSARNKLGEGGFGPVFKGKLSNGQEIAVKRLSKSSGQGVEEFKNEVALITQVQHRNLVKLLGFCTHGEERMLVYEYMLNKSLDLFIFGSATTGKAVLDWGLRTKIIVGIARGLLYLHRDSRLKIIHRDLKASNILLDEHMIPRISDFGLARIVMIDQSVANTNRIVGTLGYMSPEYALRGIFSVKSDVFSFGVLLLEIVSGKRISGFYDHEKSLDLLGYAWQLWNEDKALELLDPNLANLCNTEEVCRGIHVALLCVQQNLNDRPTMSEVVFMLCNDTDLATPKQPPFCWIRMPDDSNPGLAHQQFLDSRNEISVSAVYGR